MRVRPTEKLFLTVNPQKNSIFLSLYFCGYFSEGTPSEKYFSDGIRIFLCVFAPTEKSEIPVVIVSYKIDDRITNCSFLKWLVYCLGSSYTATFGYMQITTEISLSKKNLDNTAKCQCWLRNFRDQQIKCVLTGWAEWTLFFFTLDGTIIIFTHKQHWC